MCDKSNNNTQSTADYLAQLINDRKQVTAFPNVFMHVERLIDEGERLNSNVMKMKAFASKKTREETSKGKEGNGTGIKIENTEMVQQQQQQQSRLFHFNVMQKHVSSTLALGYKKLYTSYSIPLEPLSSMLFNLALRIEKNV
ncbi:hypothetical protein M8J77_011612 [Diaphorina citri]|nr:hypothetical protein M8J77_011612 [Diaphorina citri]